MKGPYYRAYLREKQARLEAENILEEKSRSLYMAKQELVELNAELMGHNRELIKSEKLAALGRLSAGVAHEIKNPLAYIKSNISLLEETIQRQSELLLGVMNSSGVSLDATLVKKLERSTDQEELDELKDLVHDVFRGLDRIEEIASTLTGYSHKKKDEPSLVNINDVINDSLKILQNKATPTTHVNFNQGSIPLLHGVESEFGQIFLNIVSNAFHAVRECESGIVDIQTEFKSGDIIVTIEDNGAGMPRATIDRVFDPFFTTKPVGEGTGLGLYLAYKTVKGLNGAINVNSRTGEGTLFTISIPLKSS